MRNLYIITSLALLLSSSAIAQISGPTSVYVGQITSYSYNNGGPIDGPYWTATKGTASSVSDNGSTYYGSVTWTSSGAGSVKIFASDGMIAQLSVTVNACSVTQPTGTGASRCGAGSVTLTASPGSGGTQVLWFSASTGGTQLASGTSYSPTISSNTTYYISTYNSTTGCQSTPRVAVTASVSGSALSSPTPPSSGTSRCGAGTFSLAATPAAGGNTIKWYPDATSAALFTGTSYTTASISASTTYYITTYNTSTNCESARLAVPLTVNSTGTISPTTVNQFTSASSTIGISGPIGTIVRWEKNVNSAGWTTISNNTSTNSYSIGPVATNTITQIRVVLNNACGNPSYSPLSTVSVYVPPAILVDGVAVTSVVNNYGSGITLTIPSQTYYSAYQWYRDGSPVGTSTNTYAPTIAGVYTVKVTLTGGAFTTTPGVTVIQPTMQSDSVNVASKTVFIKSGVTSVTDGYSLAPNELAQILSYSDGLGAVVQQVAVGQSPAGGDMVRPLISGKNKIVDSVYLPYPASARDGRFRKDAIRGSSIYPSYTTSGQYSAYQSTSKVAVDAQPYAVSQYYSTPELRVKDQGAPGTAWQPAQTPSHSQQVSRTSANTGFPSVRLWKSDGTTAASYASNKIWGSVSKDENGNTTVVYTDSRGLVVLKRIQENPAATTWLDTYYVYDDYGQLKMQIPPRALEVLGTGSSLDANSTTVSELVFKYTYDNRGRLIQKKVPGSATQDIIYDQFDRVVLTQDAIQRTQNYWMFTKYDFKNRVVYKGIFTSTSNRSTLQAQLDIIDYSSQPYYEEEVSSTYQGYSNTVFPITNIAVHQFFYYDHYDFNRNGAADHTYNATHLAGGAVSSATRGLPTGSKTLVLGTTDFVTKAVFYDNLDRPIQIQSDNPLNINLSLPDITTILYHTNNLTAKPQKIKSTQVVGATTTNITQRYTYDNSWRLSAIYHTVGTGTEYKVVTYEYNAIGQVVAKKLHDTGTPLQTVDMRYNIRGWITSINNAQLVSDGGTTNNDTNDYFGMELFYNTSESSSLGNTARYDGTISAMKWKNAGTASGAADQRSYKFTYDNSNRLSSAAFQAYSGTVWNKESNTLNESMTYDKNGNIQTLLRNENLRGLTGTTITSATSALDNLTYTYSTTSQNQLTKVADSGSTGGFNDGSNVTTEYTYDNLGSMTSDLNKGISAITYNHLGKPSQVTFSNGNTIAYSYDATGSRFKTVTTIGANTSTTAEIGGFTYIDNALKHIKSPEGRVLINAGSPEYQYFITDHLGNNRVVFTSAAQTAVQTIATFEGDANDQQGQFVNVSAGNITSFTAANHTASGIKVIRLNQAYKTGPGYSRKVFAGDKVDMEVWTYYEPTSGWSSSNLATNVMIAAVAGGFGGVSGAAGEAGKIFDGVNSAISGFGLGVNQADDSPSAFLNYILFDKNYKVLDMGWTAVPETANWSKQKMTIPQVTVKEVGYIFVYLSYEGQSNLYANFDDFKVTYTPSNIIQSNEYYPFGLQAANSWTRENALGNDYLANGGTKFNTTSALYDLDFRNFDPILGRLTQVDPLADTYGSYSPYHYSYNDPVNFNDVAGLEPRWGLYNQEHSSLFAGDGSDVRRTYGGGGYVQESAADFIKRAIDSKYGGSWSNGSGYLFENDDQAFAAAYAYNQRFNSWGNTQTGSRSASLKDWRTVKRDGVYWKDYSYYDYASNQVVFGSKPIKLGNGAYPFYTQGGGQYSFGGTGWAPYDYEQGRYGVRTMSNYRMDVNLSVYRVPILGSDGRTIGYKSRATVSAVSYVSASGSPVFARANASLLISGNVIESAELQVLGPALIQGGSQYSYIGEATFDLPTTTHQLQINIQGGWTIQYDNINTGIPTVDPLGFVPLIVNGTMGIK